MCARPRQCNWGVNADFEHVAWRAKVGHCFCSSAHTLPVTCRHTAIAPHPIIVPCHTSHGRARGAERIFADQVSHNGKLCVGNVRQCGSGVTRSLGQVRVLYSMAGADNPPHCGAAGLDGTATTHTIAGGTLMQATNPDGYGYADGGPGVSRFISPLDVVVVPDGTKCVKHLLYTSARARRALLHGRDNPYALGHRGLVRRDRKNQRTQRLLPS